MIRHLLLVLACTGCFDTATLAPQPDAGDDDNPVDAGSGSDTGTPLPPGVTMLAPGHYLGLAAQAANGKIYGLEYSDPSITAHPVRIVSIDTTTGIASTFYDLPTGSSPTNLQTTDSALYWLETSTSNEVTLYRKTFASQASAAAGIVASPTTVPTGTHLDMYALYPGDNKIYLLVTKGASYNLGWIPMNAVNTLTTSAFTSLVSGTIPNATTISFTDYTNTIGHLGTIVYAGGRATGTTSRGFVLEFNAMAKTVTTVSDLQDTFMHSFWATGVRVHWIAEKAGMMTMYTGDPIIPGNNGAVATLPFSTYSLIAQGSHFFVTSLPGDATDLLAVQPGTTPAIPPTGTTSMVASLDDCVGQTSQTCVAKISLLAADANAVYWSTSTGVYKYTP